GWRGPAGDRAGRRTRGRSWRVLSRRPSARRLHRAGRSDPPRPGQADPGRGAAPAADRFRCQIAALRGRTHALQRHAGRGGGRRAVPHRGAQTDRGRQWPHDHDGTRAPATGRVAHGMGARTGRCPVPPLRPATITVMAGERPGWSGNGAEQAIAALGDARQRTLDLVAPLAEADLERVHSTLMSPLVWDLGHIAAFEDLWLVHRHGDKPLLHEDLAAIYDAFETPRSARGDLPFLRPSEARDYLA